MDETDKVLLVVLLGMVGLVAIVGLILWIVSRRIRSSRRSFERRRMVLRHHMKRRGAIPGLCLGCGFKVDDTHAYCLACQGR